MDFTRIPRVGRLVAVTAVIGVPMAALTSGHVAASEASRIGRLETEIQQLRSQIDEQNRRIQRLEAELGRQAGPSAAPPSRSRTSASRADQPIARGPQPWHSAAAWDRVAKGMTTDEVTVILGTPTAAESVGGLKTLFYRGTTAGGASLQGHVNLRDERVLAVSKPAFQATPNP